VKDILNDYEDILATVNQLMKKLKNIIPSAKLRKFTPLKPKCRNVTRWSSTYEMLRRYKRLRRFLPLLNLDEIEDLLPSSRQDRDIDNLLTLLAELDLVTKALQAEDRTLVEVRNLFDEVMTSVERETGHRLGEDANIIHDKVFESAVRKIQRGRQDDLTLDEAVAVRGLRRNNTEVRMQDTLSLVERALKRHRGTTTASEYIDCRFITPTSNFCERLFSESGYSLNSRRMQILPSNFEAQMFCRSNKKWWGVKEINDILNADGSDSDADEDDQYSSAEE